MADREELTRRDAAAWRAFEALLAAVPTQRRETPDLEGGWSVKDVLWHVGYWWDDFRRSAESGDWSEGDETTDDINAREQEVSRSMSWNQVRTAVHARREAMLATWRALPDVDDRLAESFLSETVEHYDEHLPQLRELLDAEDE
jgi:uncharacterized damage-inducible protein DinB